MSEANPTKGSYFARRKSQYEYLLLFDAFSLTSSTINYRAEQGGRGGKAVQGRVNLGYTSVAKTGHVRGINLQVEGGGRVVRERFVQFNSKDGRILFSRRFGFNFTGRLNVGAKLDFLDLTFIPFRYSIGQFERMSFI